jgi:hypothetical protein
VTFLQIGPHIVRAINLKQANDNLNLVLLILLKLAGAVLVLGLILFGVVAGRRAASRLLYPSRGRIER